MVCIVLKCKKYFEYCMRWFYIYDDKNQKQNDLMNDEVAGASHETIQRYGSIAKQYYFEYSEEDAELGKNWLKNQNGFRRKVHPDYEY